VSDPLEVLRGGLVVSVQASPDSPLADTSHIVAMARAAEMGGAVGVRVEGAANVAAVRAAVDLPVIGLRKRRLAGSAVSITPSLGHAHGAAAAGGDVYITPSLEDAHEIAGAGADVVAVDGTLRPRPGGLAADRFLARLAEELTRPILADVDSLEAGHAARAAGAAAVATTLSGYTDRGPAPVEPDLELVSALAAELDCPVLAEGRYASPEQARAALDTGAFAVVVGTAITDPLALTRSFAAACERTVGASR
jgi:N-acylglucosamine-6-phosphate 2-epimerase